MPGVERLLEVVKFDSSLLWSDGDWNADGFVETMKASALTPELSAELFAQFGEIARIDVYVPEKQVVRA